MKKQWNDYCAELKNSERIDIEKRTSMVLKVDWLIQEIEHLKEKSEKDYEVIANFIIMDLFKQLIDFEVGENGLNFSSEEDYQKVKERSIEMGYHDWLFEDSKVTKIYKE